MNFHIVLNEKKKTFRGKKRRQYLTIWQAHSAEDFVLEEGIFLQEYFVYFKKK